MFGKRQLPATDPSVSPQEPLARVFADDNAEVQFWVLKQFAFFNQIRPVRLSFTVPSPLSANRGDTETPF